MLVVALSGGKRESHIGRYFYGDGKKQAVIVSAVNSKK